MVTPATPTLSGGCEMRLRLRLTTDSLRLTGGSSRHPVPSSSLQPLLVTENGDALITDQGELLLAGPKP